MSITASTCITFTGYENLGNTLNLYSNIDNYSISFASIPTADITGENCPYLISGIPDGTTSIQFRDPTSSCCVVIFLENNDLCNNCNLTFDLYETQTVSQIIAGNLIGSCDDNITDYIINWYGPGLNSTNIAFTSGYGTAFADIGWNHTHPLTDEQSPLVGPGVYKPVIDRVIVNGNTFTSTGEPGTYPANLNCFDNAYVTVDGWRCENGNNPGDYSHHYLFENVSVGTPPESLSATFILSSNTNYLAWRFKGFDIPDRLKMTYYGSNYGNTPITIEDIVVAGDLSSTNLAYSAFPRSADTYDFFAKVTCLTGFTITEGDYISVEITPNPTNQNTKWDFYFTCLETFDCTSCLDNFKNTPYKIVLSSITSNLVSCNRSSVFFTFSGCTLNQLSQSDIYKYFNTGANTLSYYLNAFSPVNFNRPFYFQNSSCNIFCNNSGLGSCQSPYTPCSQSSNNTINYQKSLVNGIGLIQIQFSSYSDLVHYYNSYQVMISNLGIFYDNTQINYYRLFRLKLPVPQNPLEPCGDTTDFEVYDIHCTSSVVTGGTGPYTMTITMPTIQKGLFPTNCELNCNSYIDLIVNNVNNNSLSTSNNINVTTSVGSRYIEPFYSYVPVTIQNTPVTAYTDTNYFFVTSYANQTIPYSGISNTIIPSLSAQTCNFLGNSWTPNYNPITHFQVVNSYKVEAFDQSNPANFRVYSSPITNFQYSGSTNPPYTTIYELALEYSGGTITYQNPNYCI